MMKAQKLKPTKRLDPRFEVLINVALCSVALYEESLGLRTLSLRQRVLTLSGEKRRLRLEADAFPRKDLLVFAKKQDCLYNVVFSHQLILHCHKEPFLQEAFILSGKMKCNARLFAKAEKEYVAFIHADFSEEEENIFLYELHQRPRDMSLEDYYKIMNCSIQKKGECVNFEFDSIRKRFVERICNNPQYMDEVISNIQLLDDVFQNGKPLTSSQLYDNLSKLTGLLPGSLPADQDEFHRMFYLLDPQKSFCHALKSQEIQLAYEQVREGKLSPVPVCCLALIRFKKWLTAVLEGKIGLNDPPDAYFKQWAEKCYEINIDKSQKLKAFFQWQFPYGKTDRELYKSELWERITKCRKQLKEFNFPEYFNILLTREDSQNHFIDQCWLDIYTEDHSCEMGQGIVLNEMIRFYMGKLARLDPALVNPTLNIRQMKKDFKVILSVMILNPEITERLWKAFSKFSRAEMGQKPFLFMVEDLKEIIEEIYREAMNNLIALLETQPDKVIETYAKKMLRVLEELQLVTPEFGQGLDKYVTDLKRASEMMLKCIIGQQSSPLENKETPYDEMQTQVIKTKIPQILAFNYNNIKDDKLLLVLKALIKLKAIPPTTTLPQFRRLFNGQEVTDPMEWWASQGDLMVFIKEMVRINDQEFASYNQHWNIAVKCFVKKGGIKAFDPQNLRLSKPTIRERRFLEAARKIK